METAGAESFLLEYMWCDFGPNTSGESLDKLVTDFNEGTKNSDHPVESAWGYFPTFETDAYDAIWLNVWSDEDQRNAGWRDWAADNQEDFEAKHNDTLNCREDRIFQFTGTAGMTPRVEWTAEPPFNADFYFCTFKGENGMDELFKMAMTMQLAFTGKMLLKGRLAIVIIVRQISDLDLMKLNHVKP